LFTACQYLSYQSEGLHGTKGLLENVQTYLENPAMRNHIRGEPCGREDSRSLRASSSPLTRGITISATDNTTEMLRAAKTVRASFPPNASMMIPLTVDRRETLQASLWEGANEVLHIDYVGSENLLATGC
jgi:hypothetical protein